MLCSGTPSPNLLDKLDVEMVGGLPLTVESCPCCFLPRAPSRALALQSLSGHTFFRFTSFILFSLPPSHLSFPVDQMQKNTTRIPSEERVLTMSELSAVLSPRSLKPRSVFWIAVQCILFSWQAGGCWDWNLNIGHLGTGGHQPIGYLQANITLTLLIRIWISIVILILATWGPAASTQLSTFSQYHTNVSATTFTKY